MTRKMALKPCETKLANIEVTPLAIWPIVKSHTNLDGLKAPIAIHITRILGQKFQPVDKSNAIVDCLEKQFKPYKLCDEIHERQVKARLQALLVAVVNDPSEKVRTCDLQKLINSLKLKNACGIDGIPNECLRHLPRRPLVHLTHLINHCVESHSYLRVSRPHSPHGCPARGAPRYRPPHPEYNRLTSYLPTTATGTGSARHRHSRVRHYAEGWHSSPFREFLVIGSTYRAQQGQRLASMR
jgi:hypothetical protein